MKLGPDVLPDSVRRTLERRIAKWRALHGGDKEVFFPQRHDPAVRRFRISPSPKACRTRSGSWAASRASTERTRCRRVFKNLDRDAELDFTGRYGDLCRHYGMEATRNNPGVANENGSIERQRPLDSPRPGCAGKPAFPTSGAYRAFVARPSQRSPRQGGRRGARDAEALPKRRPTSVTVTAKVTRNSSVNVDKVLYSVRSADWRQNRGASLRRPAGMLPRSGPGHAHDGVRTVRARGHAIDYHHLIGTLRRKPQALRYLVYREALFRAPPPAPGPSWTTPCRHAYDGRIAGFGVDP